MHMASQVTESVQTSPFGVLKPCFSLSLIGLQLEVALRYANRASTQKQQAATEGGTAMFPTNHFWSRSIRRSTAFCVYLYTFIYSKSAVLFSFAKVCHYHQHKTSFSNSLIPARLADDKSLVVFRECHIFAARRHPA